MVMRPIEVVGLLCPIGVPLLVLGVASAIWCMATGTPFELLAWWHGLKWWRANWWCTTWLSIAMGLPSLLILALIVSWIRPVTGRGKATKPPKGGGTWPPIPAASDNFGSARLMTETECLQAYPGPDGVVIGELAKGQAGHAQLVVDAIATGAGHSMLVAGARSGKTMSAVTTLMKFPGSVAVLDPPAELGGMLKEPLEDMGKRVFILNPNTSHSGFNVLDWINPTKPLAGMDVKSMISWIFPDEATTDTKKDSYFEPSGRSMCDAILSDLLWSDRPAAEKTLKTFRELVNTEEKVMPTLLETIFSRSNSSRARQLAGTFMAIADKQFSGIYGQAVQGTEWLADPDLANLVSGSSFHSSDLLDHNTVVFTQIPLRVLKQAPGVGRVIMGALMSAVYEFGTQRGGRILMLLDEAAALGRMAIIEDAMVFGPKFGLVIQLLYQSIGQAKKVWGDDGLMTLYNNLSWRGYAAIRDDTTAEQVSKEFGEYGVMATSVGENSGTSSQGMALGSRSKGKTTSVSEMRRRVVLPQELRAAPPDTLFVISAAGNMKLRMAQYWRRPDLNAIVNPSHFVA